MNTKPWQVVLGFTAVAIAVILPPIINGMADRQLLKEFLNEQVRYNVTSEFNKLKERRP